MVMPCIWQLVVAQYWDDTGRTGAWALSRTGVVSTNATIRYNYLDYWDVPDNELVYNPPADGSAPVVNPKQ